MDSTTSATNSIGLDTAKSKEIADNLNDLLANYQLFYMNVRGYHWNIKGDKFFELHIKFEELYSDLVLKIDEIAERVLTLGYTPLHSFEDYLEVASIHSNKNISIGRDCVDSIVDSFKIVIQKQRKILNLTADNIDEGTNAMMSDYVREQEKQIWMYSSFLGV